MKNYRLKKEAVQFFKKDLATRIHTGDVWEKLNVDEIALEEVEEAYIEYGHPLGDSGSSLSGWNKKGTHFHFTIVFPSVKYNEHDKFTKGKLTRELMNNMQYHINNHYNQFASEVKEKS